MSDVRIAVLGDRNLDYVTHRELDAALARFPSWADAAWVATDGDVDAALDAVDGVWVVPGTPYRDDDAVYAAIGSRARGRACRCSGRAAAFSTRSSSWPAAWPGSTRATRRPIPTRMRWWSRRWRAASSASSAP